MDEFDEYRERLSRDPDDQAAYRALLLGLRESGRLRECAALVERWSERKQDPIELAAIFAEAGALREELEDDEKARKHYARALELDPRQASAGAAFVRISDSLRDVHRQLEVLEKWSADLQAASASAYERAQVELALGRASSGLPGRLDRAFAHYRAAVTLDPESETALDEAVEKARKARRTQDVRALLELAISATRNPERRSALLRELASAQREPPVDPDGLIETARRSLELSPTDTGLLEAFAAALGARAGKRRGSPEEARDRAEIAEVEVALARLATGPEVARHLGLALDADPLNQAALSLLGHEASTAAAQDLYLARVAARLALVPDDATAARIRREGAAMYAGRERFSEAFELIEPLLGTKPDQALAAEAFSYAKRASRFVEAVHLVAPSIATAGGRLEALRGIVREARGAGDLFALAEASRILLALSPDDDEALAGLMEFHTRRGEPTGTRAWLERRIVAATSPSARRDLLRGLVELADGPLADEALATDAYQKLAEIDVRDPDVRAELISRLERTGRLRALADVRAWEATNLESRDERKDALAALRELDARSPLESGLVLRTLRAYRSADPADQDVRRWLIELARDAGELEEVASLLREEIHASRDDERRIASLGELAELLERNTRDDEGARISALHLLDLEPNHLVEVERLERIATRSGDRERIIEACARRAAATPEEARVEVLVRLAALLEQPPIDEARAIEIWREVRAIAPDRVDAAEALLRLYGATSRHFDSIALLDEIGASTRDDEIRISALRERARIFADELGLAEEAAESYRALRLVREDDEAYVALVTYARATGRADELVELLGMRLAQSTNPEERHALGRERGLVLLFALDDLSAAEDELVKVAASAPTDVEVLSALATIYERMEDSGRLADVTASLLSVATLPEVRAELARRLVVLHERFVVDPKRALAANRAWVEASPDDLDGLRGLAERLDPSSDREELVRALDTRADKLASSLAESATEAKDALRDEAFTALLESATLRAQSEPDRAEERLLRALELGYQRPADVETVIGKARELDVAASSEAMRRSVATYLARRATTAARPTKDRLFLVSADLFGSGLSDVSRAFEVLRRGLEECPDDEEIRRSLVDYALTSGFEDELDRVLAKVFDASVDPATSRALLRERADILFSLGRSGAAADQYRRLATMDPSDERAQERHRESLVRAGRADELVHALDQAIRRLPPDELEKRITFAREIARTWEGPLNNRLEALDAYRKLAKLVPDDAEVLASIERLSPKSRVGLDPDAQPALSRSLPPPPPKQALRPAIAEPPSRDDENHDER